MKSTKKKSGKKETGLDLYNLLIKNFPLRPLRSEAQYEKAVKISEDLLDRFNDLTKAEKDYFDVLDYLIGDYESREFAEDQIACEPRELIQSLMDANDLRQSDLVPFFGTRSRVSEFLSGRRDLSIPQIQALCDRFKLRAESLLPRLNEATG